jgi:hypothetical protein
MAPLPHDPDITSWPQLLSAIEDAEAGQGTARLTEICLSVYSALAAAQFQITQLKARVHVLATSRPGPHGDPMTVAGSRLPPPAKRLTAWRRLNSRMRRWRSGLLRPGGPPDARRKSLLRPAANTW